MISILKVLSSVVILFLGLEAIKHNFASNKHTHTHTHKQKCVCIILLTLELEYEN